MCKKCDDIITCAASSNYMRPDRIRIIKEMPGSVASGTLCIIIKEKPLVFTENRKAITRPLVS